MAKTAFGGAHSASAKKLSDIAKRPTPKHGIYDEDSILHLEGLEHIRLRPGMYIGSLGDGSNENDGIYILLKEGIDNAVDEFSQGFGKRIDIDIRDGRVKIRDYGRGIPLGKLDDCVSNVNTGAKYNNTVFKQAIGMNGVGIKATNALSSYFRAASVRDGKMAVVEYAHGEKTDEKLGKAKDGVKNGTYLEFVPDEDIFGSYTFNMDMVEKRLWNYAYLNPGLLIGKVAIALGIAAVLAGSSARSACVCVPSSRSPRPTRFSPSRCPSSHRSPPSTWEAPASLRPSSPTWSSRADAPPRSPRRTGVSPSRTGRP